MPRGENVCDLSSKVQSISSTHDSESEVRLDPVDQKMANIRAHVTAAIPQADYMWRNTSSETRSCLSLSGTHLTSSHHCNWKERGGRWETLHTCLCHHPTFTEIVFIMLWFPKEFCSRCFKFLHTAGALWGLRYLITSCKQLSGYSGGSCPEIFSTADWISP